MLGVAPTIRLGDLFQQAARSLPAAKAPAPPPLRRGSTGATVTDLQKKLVSLGYLSRDAFSSGPGVFGPRTEHAVKLFQKANGLRTTGQVGDYTRAALASAATKLAAR